MAKQGSEADAKVSPASTTSDASKAVHVMELVKQFDFLSIGLGGKIHCALTNKDLPLNTVAIQQHINSKKLKKQREWYSADFSKYEPLIVPHRTNPKLLFCTLTHVELNRIPKQVEAHINGRRYRNRKAEMEGLKEAQRQPKRDQGSEAEGEEEQDQEEVEAGFWAPTESTEVGDMEDGGSESEPEGEEDEDEEVEDDEAGEGLGAGGGRAPREGKANAAKRGTQAGRRVKASGKTNKSKKPVKGVPAAGGGGEQEDSSASKPQGVKKGEAGKKKGCAKNKPQGGKRVNGVRANGGSADPLLDEIPAVSNNAGACDAPGGKKAKTKARDAKKANGGKTQDTKGVAGGGGHPVVVAAMTAAATTKRKHKVSEEPVNKKKRKG